MESVSQIHNIFYVYWTTHHCDSWRIKDQFDVTCYFISLLMRSTCFGHYHQEFATILLNYHIGRIVLGSMCVGVSVWLGWSGIRLFLQFLTDRYSTVCLGTNFTKSTIVRTNTLFSTYVQFSQFCVSSWCLLQTDSHSSPHTSAAPALCWTATKAHLCHRVITTSHITHAVWRHCSRAEVCAGIFSEGEQPTTVTCNYERLAERNSQTDRWAVLHWTAINLPHTCLVSRTLQ